MIFDTHAHYDDEDFDQDRDSLLLSMKKQGIGRIVNVAASVSGIDTTLALADKYPFLYAAIGVHPDGVGEMNEEVLTKLHRESRREKVVAIGEIGLDYYWDKEHHDLQIEWFEKQIEVARQEKLPVIVHSREAASDTLEVAKRQRLGDVGGIIHCFSYGKEIASEYLNMGMYLGIGGVVTFKNAKKLKEVVSYAPMEQLVLETDCPYLSPEPYRGKRNSSLNLPYVAEMIAQIKGIDTDKVIKITEENAYRIFGIG